MLVAPPIAPIDRVSMSQKRPRPGEGVPDDVKRQEGKDLHRLWKMRKNQKLTQAEFADRLGYSAGYFPQFFSGLRPLTVEIATAFADELDVDVAAFSPRLAQDMEKAVEATGWPFKRFSRLDYKDLSTRQKEAVEAFVVSLLPEDAAPAARKIRRVQ